MNLGNKIIEVFRSKGYKATPQRIAIANTVLNSKKHPSAETIYEEVNQVYPTISLSTVYNTLHVLRDLDLVNELTFHDNTRYDPNIEIHVSSEETYQVALKINEIRVKNSLPRMIIVIIPLVLDEDGTRLSSTKIRKKLSEK